MKKELKDYEFTWDEELKMLLIGDNRTRLAVMVDKVRMLSLMRFMIRVMQHLSVHKRHEKISK